MRVNDDYPQCNAEKQVADATSVFNFWKCILQLRKQYRDIFIYGRFQLVEHDHASIICYQRIYDHHVATVTLNFDYSEQEWSPTPDVVSAWKNGKEILANYAGAGKMLHQRIYLRPYEAVVMLESQSKHHL